MLTAVRRSSSLVRLARCRFSKQDVVSYSIEEIDPVVLKQLVYIPKEKIVFVDRKYLLYRNKPNLLTNWYLFSHLTIPFAYLAILIKKNPFYLTFPAALPLMFLTEVFLLRRMFIKQKKYRPIVQEISLMDCGTIVEVKYANTYTRKLRDLPIVSYIPISQFDKVREPDEDPVMHQEFPRSLAYDPPGPFEYAWMKVIRHGKHIMIPRRYDYANMEMLIEILKGKIVLTDEEDCAKAQAKLQLLK